MDFPRGTGRYFHTLHGVDRLYAIDLSASMLRSAEIRHKPDNTIGQHCETATMLLLVVEQTITAAVCIVIKLGSFLTRQHTIFRWGAIHRYYALPNMLTMECLICR